MPAARLGARRPKGEVSDRYAIALPVGAGRMNFLLIVILGDGTIMLEVK